MAADDIDPKFVQLCKDHPRQTFLYEGEGVIWTSTCTTMPMRTTINGRYETTNLMRADIRFYYDTLRAAGLSRSETFAAISDRYGRERSSIEEALRLFPKSE